MWLIFFGGAFVVEGDPAWFFMVFGENRFQSDFRGMHFSYKARGSFLFHISNYQIAHE